MSDAVQIIEQRLEQQKAAATAQEATKRQEMRDRNARAEEKAIDQFAALQQEVNDLIADFLKRAREDERGAYFDFVIVRERHLFRRSIKRAVLPIGSYVDLATFSRRLTYVFLGSNGWLWQSTKPDAVRYTFGSSRIFDADPLVLVKNDLYWRLRDAAYRR